MISKDINILTHRELDAIKNEAFQKGVERGKFEASAEYRKGPYARNCKNWEDGLCETCGVQWQYFEIGADHKCEHFSERK